MGEEYYDKEYFEYQKKMGEFGGKANQFLFREYIGKNDDVLDFGCGGGFTLKGYDTTGKKVGVEINPSAREIAKSIGIDEVHERIQEIPDNYVNVATSNHCLEHVEDPASILKEMKRVVKPQGKIIIVVPHEVKGKVIEDDVDKHIYTWSPQNMKNLFEFCGIRVISAQRINHRWCPKRMWVTKHLGWNIFNALSRVYSFITNTHQTRVVGVVEK